MAVEAAAEDLADAMEVAEVEEEVEAEAVVEEEDAMAAVVG